MKHLYSVIIIEDGISHVYLKSVDFKGDVVGRVVGRVVAQSRSGAVSTLLQCPDSKYKLICPLSYDSYIFMYTVHYVFFLSWKKKMERKYFRA